MNAKELTEKIDELVAIASTTTNPDTQLEKIEEAFKQACLFLKGLKRQLKKAIEVSVARLPHGSTGLKVPLKDLASSQPGLEVFESPEAFGDFLDSTVDLLESQRGMSREQIAQAFAEFKRTYEQLVAFKLDARELESAMQKLENFYCKPPNGGRGSALNPSGNGPAGGTQESRSKTMEVLGILAGIGSFILEVGKELWPLIFSAKEAKRSKLPVAYEVLALAAVNTILTRIIAEFGEEVLERERLRQYATMTADE